MSGGRRGKYVYEIEIYILCERFNHENWPNTTLSLRASIEFNGRKERERASEFAHLTHLINAEYQPKAIERSYTFC